MEQDLGITKKKLLKIKKKKNVGIPKATQYQRAPDISVYETNQNCWFINIHILT